MDIAEILRHILIVLVAAKLAAEVAERLGIPAVVGEIVAGILIGPSLLNAVGGGDEVLRTLGEIGVILLLLDVGLEMDLGELSKVGRTSLLVAVIGVAAPMVLGFGAMELMGEDFNTALFVGAALTATSVGITARVFGDLRAIATTEARVVLGAAVADDVMGLVVLTVVVRLVTEGSVSVLAVGGIILVALAFLVLGVLIGLRAAPALFGAIDRVSRSTGTLVAIALAFTLAFAELADSAKLAPIVGAFVAGIALSKARESDRIRRELTPVGHLFIPVFFLQIGIDADVSAFGRAEVLRDAAILLVVAVVGKLLSPLGAIGGQGDKALIGLGMLPRGEVGLIFATIGLQNGVLGDDLYAALLLVVLVTTLVTPPLLKARYAKLRGDLLPAATPADAPTPSGGWLRVVGDEVDLAARPPDHLVVPIGIDAAIALGRRRPTQALVDWLAEAAPGSVPLDEKLTAKLLDAIEFGNARTWQLLESSGVLARVLPEIAEALSDRDRDPYSLDPLHSHRFVALERMRRLNPDDPLAREIEQLQHVDRLLLAAFLVEALEDQRDPLADAQRVLVRLAVSEDDRAAVVALVADHDLLWSASRQPGAMSETPVLQLAAHLDTPEQARALYALSQLRSEGRERWEVQRLRALHELVQTVLSDDRLSGVEARSLADQHRQSAAGLLAGSPRALARLDAAPQAYVLRTPAEVLARHARLLERSGRAPHVDVTSVADGEWWVDVACRDQPGLLAAVTGVLADQGLAVDDAVLATWDDGVVLDGFRVLGSTAPDPSAIEAALAAALDAPITSSPIEDAEVTFDGAASPWHTLCEVIVSDRPGVLHALAAAFAGAGIEVRAAQVTSQGGLVIDRFEVTDRSGSKLTADDERRFRELLRAGVAAKRRRLGRGLTVRSLVPIVS
jgi:Kef-type K+ transport system membrane component KefB/predicted amino acid-binding ACT domain protein